MSYLFLVNIGPVQDFIASARRTRDLAFGSWLLSDLARTAALQIALTNGLDNLIFPAPKSMNLLAEPETDFNVANKIVALIEKSPQSMSEQINKAITDRLREIRKEADSHIYTQTLNLGMRDAQIDDLVEFLWVALHYNETDEKSYMSTRRRLEALMAARKNTRDFAQVTWTDYVPKSSIDGQLESVIPENEYPARWESDQENLKRIQQLYTHYKAGQAERLSGVDLLKRNSEAATFGANFPSTSHMATLPFLQRMKILNGQSKDEVITAWSTYISKLQEIGVPQRLEHVPAWYPAHPILEKYEGSMLFEDRLVDVLYIPSSKKGKNALQEAKGALQVFYRELDTQFTALGFSKERPNSYYAFLQADGDGMGRVITEQAKHGYKQHRLLSHQLAAFAGQARKIVEDNRGVLVYAGGDDVLAFLPLDTVIECAWELSEQFSDDLHAFPDENGKPPTLSVGVAVAHHLDSLHNVRELVKKAERRAKDFGKNALAITVSKRSGEDYTTVGHWGKVETELLQFITYYQDGVIPSGAAYELRDMLLRLTVSIRDAQPSKELQEVVDTLMKVIRCDTQRILQRKLRVPQDKLPEDEAKKIESFFSAQLERLGEKPQGKQEEAFDPLKKAFDGFKRFISDFEQLINELIIAQLFADAKLLANPKKEPKQ